jgi:hypothetical protein
MSRIETKSLEIRSRDEQFELDLATDCGWTLMSSQTIPDRAGNWNTTKLVLQRDQDDKLAMDLVSCANEWREVNKKEDEIPTGFDPGDPFKIFVLIFIITMIIGWIITSFTTSLIIAAVVAIGISIYFSSKKSDAQAVIDKIKSEIEIEKEACLNRILQPIQDAGRSAKKYDRKLYFICVGKYL